jgi:phospholipid/cholesterol/gamma-HCH transport system substrate-binding protein
MKLYNLPGKLAACLVLLTGALVIFAFYFNVAGGTLPFSTHSYTVKALVADPQDLLKHADVDSAGVKVGTVADIGNDYTPAGTYAVVTMHLNNEIAPLYRDATVIVRQKTLVGENYIEVDKGTPRAGVLPDGSTLSPSADQQTVPLDKLMNSLDPVNRRRISATLRALGAGVNGRGADINDMAAQLSPTVSNGEAVVSALNSENRQTADVIQQAGTVLGAIARRQADMQTLIGAAKTTATAVAARDQAFRDMLGQFPPTLRHAQRSVATLSGFSTQATPVISHLRMAMHTLQPVIRELGPTAATARRLLTDLQPMTTAANPLLGNLRSFSSAATPALAQLDSMLLQANPALDHLEPYYREVTNMFSTMGSATYVTRFGRILNCACPITLDSYGGYTPAERAALQALIDAGILGQVGELASNPYRAPGSLPDAATPWSGTYPFIGPAERARTRARCRGSGSGLRARGAPGRRRCARRRSASARAPACRSRSPRRRSPARRERRSPRSRPR